MDAISASGCGMWLTESEYGVGKRRGLKRGRVQGTPLPSSPTSTLHRKSPSRHAPNLTPRLLSTLPLPCCHPPSLPLVVVGGLRVGVVEG